MIDLEQRAHEKFGLPLAALDDSDVCTMLMDMVREKAAELPVTEGKRRLYYLSAEFLIGRLLTNNLIELGVYDDVKDQLAAAGHDLGASRGSARSSRPWATADWAVLPRASWTPSQRLAFPATAWA
jgi:glucan phosphorylase